MLQIRIGDFSKATQEHLSKVKETQIKKLKAMKERGASKQRCYDNFPKAFVDLYY